MTDKLQQLTSKDVRALLGGISDMTLWRLEQDLQAGFPKPARIRSRRYWSEAALAAWIAGQGGAQ